MFRLTRQENLRCWLLAAIALVVVWACIVLGGILCQ